MGNQQQGTRIALQPVFQPEDRIQVEVVGRLVEQQQVGRAHQCLGQVQAHPPATGEVAHPAFHLLVAETQPGQQLARPGVGTVALGIVQLHVQAGDGRTIVGRLGNAQCLLDRPQRHVTIEHIVDGQTLEGVDLLAHVRNAPVGRQLAVTSVGSQLTSQKGEQGGFTSAVGTDQTGFVAGVQCQLGTFEKALRAALQGKILQSDHKAAEFSSSPGRTACVMRCGSLP